MGSAPATQGYAAPRLDIRSEQPPLRIFVNWAQAFARQARSDFEAREHLLQSNELPQCHQLHYLQMAMEKTAKAHLIAGRADAQTLQSNHAYIAKVVPIIVREGLARAPGIRAAGWVTEAIRTTGPANRIASSSSDRWRHRAGQLRIPLGRCGEASCGAGRTRLQIGSAQRESCRNDDQGGSSTGDCAFG